MSVIILLRSARPVNSHCRRIGKYAYPSMAGTLALRGFWRRLAVDEASSSSGCQLGIARCRQELLGAFPAWRIPEVTDALNRPWPEGVAL